MKPYYQEGWVTQYCGDALGILPELPSDSVDLLATDPPYGISFMGKDWDKALPDKRIWAECFRVLRSGAFAFVMSIPRADCLSRMIISLEDVGFMVNFTPIFWAYASGFPKAQNIGKAVDKKLGAKRKVVGEYQRPDGSKPRKNVIVDTALFGNADSNDQLRTTPATPNAKALDGSYGGFQPKPAVEVIIVAMKPLSEKTFVDQALKNRKGITWLDDGRIPYESERDERENNRETRLRDSNTHYNGWGLSNSRHIINPNYQGRFPANLLVSDDVLNIESKGAFAPVKSGQKSWGGQIYGKFASSGDDGKSFYGDSGSFSRYFDLDKWWAKTFPFLIVPKASKGEKNRYLDLHERESGRGTSRRCASCGKPIVGLSQEERCTCDNRIEQHTKLKNYHPTVKPLKLMSYLITLGSRAGDTVLDPFSGSGTTPVACQLLNRHCVAIEIKEKYCEISVNRCSQSVMELICGTSL